MPSQTNVAAAGTVTASNSAMSRRDRPVHLGS
jgi:hypothetical protein